MEWPRSLVFIFLSSSHSWALTVCHIFYSGITCVLNRGGTGDWKSFLDMACAWLEREAISILQGPSSRIASQHLKGGAKSNPLTVRTTWRALGRFSLMLPFRCVRLIFLTPSFFRGNKTEPCYGLLGGGYYVDRYYVVS